MPADPTGLILLAACLVVFLGETVSRRRRRRRLASAAAAQVRSALPRLKQAVAAWGGGVVHVNWKATATAVSVVFVAAGATYRVDIRGAASLSEAIYAAAGLIESALDATQVEDGDDVRDIPAGAVPLAGWRDVLEVGPDARLKDVDAAWRKLARRHHPDLGGEPHRMAAINAARDEAHAELG